MDFDHVCYSDEQAAAEKRRILDALPNTPIMVGPIPSWLAATLVGVVLTVLIPFLAAAIDPTFKSTIFEGMTVLWAIVIVATIVGVHSIRETDNSWDYQRGQVEANFAPADAESLRFLLSLSTAHPAVDTTVKSWLADGKTIRCRDVRAVEDFDDAAAPELLQAALRGDVAARTALAVASKAVASSDDDDFSLPWLRRY